MGAKSKHVPSFLISEKENDIVLDVLGSKKHSLATAVVQLLLAPPPSRDKWEKRATGVGCLVKDGTTRSYYIRIVDLKNQTIVWEQELYRQFKYRAVTITFHTFNAHDCRAGLNFCDEEEALLFRAAIKERIKEFKRKREANRARKMARNYHAMLQQQATYQAMPMVQYIPSSIAGQQGIYQVASQVGGFPGQWPQMQGMQHMNSQMNMQHGRPSQMNVLKLGPGGTRQVVQVPAEGLYGSASGIYSTVDRQMAGMAITRSNTSIQEKKKKKGGLLSFLKRKKDAVPPSSSQISTLEPNAKKDRGSTDKSSTKPPRPPPPPSSPKPPRPPPPTSALSSQQAAPSSPKPPRPPPPSSTMSTQSAPSSPKPPRPPPPSRQLDDTEGTIAMTQPAVVPQEPQPFQSTGAPPPPPPPLPPVCAAPPPPPPPPTAIQGETQYGSARVENKQPAGGGSLMDGILSGANRLKKVDQTAPKPKSQQGGVGGALARAMDLRSKVMQDSDDDDDDDDDDWDVDDDDDEWSD